MDDKHEGGQSQDPAQPATLVDRRRIRQDDLGPPATIRTSTLKPKDTEPKSKDKTEAQKAVAASKARDAGKPVAEDTDTDTKTRKHGKPSAPPWSDNKAMTDRRVDNPESKVHAPATPSKNPLEEAELFQSPDGLDWCGCGRALYVLKDYAIVCREGHHDGKTRTDDTDSGPFTWEAAANYLRRVVGDNPKYVSSQMQVSAKDIADLWAEADEHEQTTNDDLNAHAIEKAELAEIDAAIVEHGLAKHTVRVESAPLSWRAGDTVLFNPTNGDSAVISAKPTVSPMGPMGSTRVENVLNALLDGERATSAFEGLVDAAMPFAEPQAQPGLLDAVQRQHISPLERRIDALEEELRGLRQLNVALVEHTEKQALLLTRLAQEAGMPFGVLRASFSALEALKTARKTLRAEKNRSALNWLAVAAAIMAGLPLLETWTRLIGATPQLDKDESSP